MKVAIKSPQKSPKHVPNRATLTLSAETYQKIDRLRGETSRSAWIQRLVDAEEERGERERFAARLRKEYNPAVVRETLALNQEYPVHEK